ncbi:hypothetical protein, partial [Sulfitobacter mediterraneus]
RVAHHFPISLNLHSSRLSPLFCSTLNLGFSTHEVKTGPLLIESRDPWFHRRRLPLKHQKTLGQKVWS